MKSFLEPKLYKRLKLFNKELKKNNYSLIVKTPKNKPILLNVHIKSYKFYKGIYIDRSLNLTKKSYIHY